MVLGMDECRRRLSGINSAVYLDLAQPSRLARFSAASPPAGLRPKYTSNETPPPLRKSHARGTVIAAVVPPVFSSTIQSSAVMVGSVSGGTGGRVLYASGFFVALVRFVEIQSTLVDAEK
jgi:hypothetical protein